MYLKGFISKSVYKRSSILNHVYLRYLLSKQNAILIANFKQNCMPVY